MRRSTQHYSADKKTKIAHFFSFTDDTITIKNYFSYFYAIKYFCLKSVRFYLWQAFRGSCYNAPFS